jgi:hypothetical protein
MNRSKLFLVIVLLALLVAPAASAANVHLKGGKHAEPAFYDWGLVLEASGELAGLGYADVLITLWAQGNPTATCTNQGGNQAPGQNPAPVTVMGETLIHPADFAKNGNVAFTVVTGMPETPIEGAPDCPNPNWTEEITDLAFTSATITVEQPAGTVVLTVECAIDPPTANGAVDKGDVDCW